MRYEIGDCVLIQKPKYWVSDDILRFRKRFIGETAVITKIFFDEENQPSHYRIDIDTDDLHVNTYIGPWWTPDWFTPCEQMNFSLDERQFSFLL